MSLDPVRRAALDVLVKVAAGRPLDPALEVALAVLDASGQEAARGRGFLVELVKGVLRWQGRYDCIIRRFSRRSMPGDATLRAVLRLSLHQLIACGGVPTYAAVHQAGELCRATAGARRVPYVNGLLQSVDRFLVASNEPPEQAIISLFPSERDDPLGFLSSYHSHPRWLVNRWLRRYGQDGCEKLCRHNNRPARLCLHVLAPAEPSAVAASLTAQGLTVRTGQGFARALIVEDRLARRALVQLLAAHPQLIVQDEGAQCATAWLAAGEKGRLLDLCAAPGGKTFHLRGIWPAEETVVAMDSRRERLRLLLETAKRIEVHPVGVVLADGRVPPFLASSFQAVLLDGPCSGTGVLRHHPEGRWRLRERDLAGCGERLLALARGAVSMLVAGGRLLYVTCSLEPEENEEVIAALLEQEPDLEPDPAPGFSSPQGFQAVWLPHQSRTDGFFAARLRKRVKTT